MNTADAATEIQQAPITGSAGAMLAAARKAQRLSVEDVARQLRLSVTQVSALEADDYSQLPGAVFARGFTRSYAKLVRLDPDALAEAMRVEAPPATSQMLDQPHGVAFGEKRGPWRVLYVALAVLLIAGLAGYEFLFNDRPMTTALVSPATISVPSSPTVVITPVQPMTETANAPAETVTKENDSAPAATTPEPVAQTPNAEVRELRFVFNKESWVEVRDGRGKILISKINFPNNPLTLSGVPPLSLVVGNAQSVQLFYDNKPVDLASRSTDNVARLRLE